MSNSQYTNLFLIRYSPDVAELSCDRLEQDSIVVFGEGDGETVTGGNVGDVVGCVDDGDNGEAVTGGNVDDVVGVTKEALF